MKSVLATLLFFSIAFSACSQSDSVYICVSGTAYAYHKSYSCSWLQHCTHQVKKVLKKEAEPRYRPCIPCYGRSTSSNSIKPSSSEATSFQCRAITKKGTRCSRTSRSNGYCWQHGG